MLGLRPVMVDVDRDTFNTDIRFIEKAITPMTRAIIPAHLFGQSCDMAPILDLAAAHGLYVVEDNAQSLGAVYTFPDGRHRHTGTLGHIGCTSFFPSKNLGCYGDGGALFTDDDTLAERIRMTANHGQKVKYHHAIPGWILYRPQCWKSSSVIWTVTVRHGGLPRTVTTRCFRVWTA